MSQNLLSDTYWCDDQIRKYLIQFMIIFKHMGIKIGANHRHPERISPINLRMSSSDRIVAHIIANNTKNTPLQLPIAAGSLLRIEQAPDMRKGINTKRHVKYLKPDGNFPEDIAVSTQRMPIPYRAYFKLDTFTSNQHSNYQILEQILTLFDPDINLQTTDNVLDMTRLSTVRLESILLNEQNPAGADKRTIQTTYEFMIPIYLKVPNIDKHKIITNINMNISSVDLEANTDLKDFFE